MEFKYGVILACLAFSIFLIVKEIRRRDKSRLAIRLFASLVMIASFALLIIPIQYLVKKIQSKAEIDFFTEKNNAFGDLNYHLKSHPEIKKINIYGYGLNNDELKRIKDYQLSFHPADTPSGFISASWPRKLKATEQLMVQGMYRNSTRQTVKLKLVGLGATLDSVNVKANTTKNFSLIARPKHIGKAIFNLIALQDKDTLATELVPLEVEKKEPISVLILASFPDFEYKFLKKWLFENEFKVAFRSQISKNKYNTEFLNRKAINLNRINQTLLKDIDVVIADEEEINPELLTAVSNGMGLIIRAKTIRPIQDHQPLLTDTSGKISVDSKINGLGKIVTTNITSTYQWQLAGKQMEYSKFWSLLFEKSLRKKIENYTYAIEPHWPIINQKIRILVNSFDSIPPQISINRMAVAPRQNMELPFAWDSFFWPKISGWTGLLINRHLENIFIYQKTNWLSARNLEKLKTTAEFIANQKQPIANELNNEYFVTETISKWWFLIAFLISISFLWYEQRFLENK